MKVCYDRDLSVLLVADEYIECYCLSRVSARHVGCPPAGRDGPSCKMNARKVNDLPAGRGGQSRGFETEKRLFRNRHFGARREGRA